VQNIFAKTLDGWEVELTGRANSAEKGDASRAKDSERHRGLGNVHLSPSRQDWEEEVLN